MNAEKLAVVTKTDPKEPSKRVIFQHLKDEDSPWFAFEEIAVNIKIHADGSAVLRKKWIDFKALRKVSNVEIPFDFYFTDECRYTYMDSLIPASAPPMFITVNEIVNQRLRGLIHFPGQIDMFTAPFDFAVELGYSGEYSVNHDHFMVRYRDKEFQAERYDENVKYALRQLSLQIEFAPSFRSIRPAAIALDYELDVPHQLETERANESFSFTFPRAKLAIARPKAGIRYGISWILL